MRARVESPASEVTLMRREPGPFTVPAYRSLPSSFLRGTDSPVMGDSSTCDFPSVTTPSRGIRAPGGTRSMLPICSASTGTIFSAPSLTSTACSGERSINSWMERRLRDTAQPSSVSPSAKSTTTSAPSTHSPMAAAIVVGGYSMARNGLFTVLRTRNVDMNVLMTVAVVGAEHREQAIAGHGVATDHDGGRHEGYRCGLRPGGGQHDDYTGQEQTEGSTGGE